MTTERTPKERTPLARAVELLIGLARTAEEEKKYEMEESASSPSASGQTMEQSK